MARRRLLMKLEPIKAKHRLHGAVSGCCCVWACCGCCLAALASSPTLRGSAQRAGSFTPLLGLVMVVPQTSTMVTTSEEKARPPPPPPPSSIRSSKPSPPPPKGRPPGALPKGRPPPPPPPPKSAKPPPPKPQSASVAVPSTSQSTQPTQFGRVKRPDTTAKSSSSVQAESPPSKRIRPEAALSISAPVILRDDDVFTRKGQVGEGTYGSVFVAQDNVTKEIVALKRINTKQEENGFPITAIREVKILKALSHPNVVLLKEIVTSKKSTEEGDFPENVFMVFEYLEYDLTGILRTPEIRFTADHVKSWSYQLLQGTHYMHTNKVIHRDLKASNLLVNKRGELKIADWGLARSYSADTKRLSPKVITLWYRPPELLLGATDYTDKVDLWSCGCIIAEMFIRNGFLQGQEEVQQLQLIFQTFGHPTKEEWPDIDKKCRLWPKFKPEASVVLPNRFSEVMQKRAHNAKWLTNNALKMLAELLRYNPDTRSSAGQASLSNYFFDDPPVKKAHELSMNFAVQSIHEWDCKRRHIRN